MKIKVEAEQKEVQTHEHLHLVHDKLAGFQTDTEKLKLQIDNTRLTNIQLLHWKAENKIKLESLQGKLHELESVPGANYTILIKKIEDAQTEVEFLRTDYQNMEETLDNEIFQPQMEAQFIRSQANQIRREYDPRAIAAERELLQKEYLQKIRAEEATEENIQLKSRKAYLEAQIQEFEIEKLNQSVKTQELMEGSGNPKPFSIKYPSRGATRIIKPNLPRKSLGSPF